MIKKIKHKGLRLLYEDDDPRRLSPQLVARVRNRLARLDVATKPEDMSVEGFGLHPLKGPWAGFWAVQVSGNWRIVFRFEDGNPTDVNLTDYH